MSQRRERSASPSPGVVGAGSAGAEPEEDCELQALGPGKRKGAAAGGAEATGDWLGARLRETWAGPLLAVLLLIVVLVWLVPATSARFRAPAYANPDLLHGGDADLSNAQPNDLWAIHDLLLVGYGAVFMKPGSAGAAETKHAAQELARLLPAVHPHAPCRERLAKVAGCKPGLPAVVAPIESTLISMAEVAWTCLPAEFRPNFFDSPYLPAALGSNDAAHDARNTQVKGPEALGVCRQTRWPRTCSYWVSMHAMSARADALQLGRPLLSALLPIVAGGATMCAGCTLHFRALALPQLSAAMRDDFGEFFWANKQCGAAHAHMDELQNCLPPATSRSCSTFRDELQDIRGFHRLLSDFLGAGGAEPRAMSSAVLVVMHNVVTSTVGPAFSPSERHKFYCAGDVLRKLSTSLVPEAANLGASAVPTASDSRVPGIGQHRLLTCPR